MGAVGMLGTGKKVRCQIKLRIHVSWSLATEHQDCENKLQRGAGIHRSRGMCQSQHSDH